MQAIKRVAAGLLDFKNTQDNCLIALQKMPNDQLDLLKAALPEVAKELKNKNVDENFLKNRQEFLNTTIADIEKVRQPAADTTLPGPRP